MMDEDENTFQGQKDTPGEIRGATYPNWEHSGAQCNVEETVALSMWERRRQLEVATAPAAMRNTGLLLALMMPKSGKCRWRIGALAQCNGADGSAAEISIAEECVMAKMTRRIFLPPPIASVAGHPINHLFFQRSSQSDDSPRLETLAVNRRIAPGGGH